MRIVTAVEKADAKRYRIFLDGEPAFLLYSGELKKYGIREGELLKEEDYEEICSVLLPARAKKRCLNLLQKRSYTEKKLREKLKEGGYPLESIEEAVAYVKSYHYIDDHSYAREYIFYHKEKETRRKLEEKLKEKGISQEILEEVFQEAYEDPGEEEQLQREQAKRLLKKRGYDPDTADWKEQQKQYAFLMRKGFHSSLIRQVLQEEDFTN